MPFIDKYGGSGKEQGGTIAVSLAYSGKGGYPSVFFFGWHDDSVLLNERRTRIIQDFVVGGLNSSDIIGMNGVVVTSEV